MIVERWPWLNDPDEADDEDDGAILYVDGAEYWGSGENWIRFTTPDAPAASRTPFWIFDALQSLDGGSVEKIDAGVLVRDVPCEHYRTVIEPELPRPVRKQPGRVRDKLDVEIWIGTDGLIHRVTWSSRYGTRWRPGAIPRLFGHAGAGGKSTDHRPWSTLELWDYGIDPEIPTPTLASGPSRRAVRRVLVDLYKRRRAWRKAHASD
jgi:hypothetical protein